MELGAIFAERLLVMTAIGGHRALSPSFNLFSPPLRHDGLEIERPIRTPHHFSLLSDDRINQFMRRYIERRIPHIDPLIRNRYSRSIINIDLPILPHNRPSNLRQLRLRPVLNLDRCPRLSVQINTSSRRSHDEFYAVVFGQHGETVCPDLVRCVAVARYSVCAYDDGGDVFLSFLAREERAGHGVGDQCGGYFFEDELEGCQAGALVVWSRFGAVGCVEVVHFVEAADYS